MNNKIFSVYQQDCEFYRYQDQLKWGRFQTAALVEGAMLYGIYGGIKLCREQNIVFLLAGSALIFLICSLALKDDADSEGHLNRLKKYENSDSPLCTKYPIVFPPKFGRIAMSLAILVLNLVNIFLLWWHTSWLITICFAFCCMVLLFYKTLIASIR